MIGFRSVTVIGTALLLSLSTVAAGAEPAKDSWSGFITLDWSLVLPDDSPLQNIADRVVVNAHKEWTMMVHFERQEAVGRTVKYKVRSATVDYLETLSQEAIQRGDGGSMRTLDTRTLQAKARKLGPKACNMELWVNYAVKKYWIDTGGFELEDVPESGQVLIEITDSQGTRKMSDPRSGSDNVIEPVYFEGRYTGGSPTVLEGTFDANVEPLPGLDQIYQTAGGNVEWRLFRAGCPELESACEKNARIGFRACAATKQGAFQIDCPELEADCLDDLTERLAPEPLPGTGADPSLRECFQINCWKQEDHKFQDPDLEDGIDALMECWRIFQDEWNACQDLCP